MTDAFGLSYLGAVLAGLLSFASPCILPLVPAYLGYLSGLPHDPHQDTGQNRGRRFKAALAFVLGFSAVFIGMGAAATTLNRFLFDNMNWLPLVAGGMLTLLGLHVMGIMPVSLLQYEKRLHPNFRPSGPVGAFVVGLAFAFGWTPCVGPVLAGILVVAAGRETVGEGIGFLAAYAAGMGVPFLLAALALEPFRRASARFRRFVRTAEIATGALITATGVLILTGKINLLANWMLQTFPVFGGIG